MAAERGEVDGVCGIWVSSLKSAYARYVKDGSMKPLVQMGAQDHPDLPGVPNAIKELKSEEDRQSWDLIFGQLEVARAFAAPPGLPAARVATLRKAFNDLFADPAFLEAATKRGLEIRPLTGDKMQTEIERFLATPKPVVARVKKLLDY
jgi:tripartite-type tricarboxylate transporter receptor subunit TctC